MKKYITPQPGPTPKPGKDESSDRIRYKPPFMRSPKPKPEPTPKPKPGKPKPPRKGINPPPSKIKNQKRGLKRSRANDTIMSRIKPDGTRVLTTSGIILPSKKKGTR